MARQDDLASVQNELSRRRIEHKDLQNRLEGIKIETESTKNDVSRARELCRQVADSNIKKEHEVNSLKLEVDNVRAQRASLEAAVRERERAV